MKDTDFEKDSRAHSFWQEWQGAADRAGEMDTFTAAVCNSSPDWDFVVNGGGLGKSDPLPRDMYSVYIPDANFSQVFSTDWCAVLGTRLPDQAENDLVINLT